MKAGGARLVVEHPTYPFENGKRSSLLRMPVFAYNAHVFRRLEPMIDLYTLIGDPCEGTLNGRPAMNILNGVDVSRLPLHVPRRGAKDIGLLALASMSVWQGYDRSDRGRWRAYRGGEPVTVHMVGGEGDGSLAAWKRLAQERGVADRVVFHGELHGEALDRVAARCDIGVGRTGPAPQGPVPQHDAQAAGIHGAGPALCLRGGRPLFAGGPPPSACGLPTTKAPLTWRSWRAFARRAQADEETPARMRAYAESHMSWQGVLAQVLERVGIECPER